MRQEIDKIEIKEPPLEELNKKRSCLKRTCITGCGCFFILFVISLLLLRFAIGPRTKEVKDLPTTFTNIVPVYDVDNIEKITHTSGKERSKQVELAAYLPKLILSPFVIHFDKDFKYIPRTITEREMTKWEKFIAFMTDPITDQRDVFQIEWLDLPASQKFVLEYYDTELRKKGFIIGMQSINKHIIQFTFKKEDGDIDGVFYTMDDPETPKTDYVSFTINIPIE
ncbi:MAG TPA: hypothetical protein DCS29_03670 [Candidatus Magasanikbacteria bacterium]|nr:hypothetical protein [Candidatus Magasanikbacteria bacterium]